MKTLWSVFFLACCAVLVVHPASAQTVTITEVMYDDTASTDLEWVEIYNTTDSAIDIGGWALLDCGAYPGPGSEGYIVVPAGTFIAAGQYLVLSKLPIAEFAGEVVCTQTGSWALGNSGDNLALYTAASGGTLVDGSLTVNFPDLAVTNEGNSIEKCDPNAGWTGNPAAWKESTNIFATTGRFRKCTPGTANSPCVADTEPPTIVSVAVISNLVLDVTFSESLDPTTAGTVTNYSVNNGVGNPAAATPQASPAVVRLTFGAAMPANNYTLTVSNVADVAGNPILPGSQMPFTISPPSYNILVTEVMPNPAAVADQSGEWFEIYNAGPSAVDMTGWRITDTEGTHVLTGPVTIAAGQYFVFGVNGDFATNGGLVVDYVYPYAAGSGLQLSNTADDITLKDTALNNVASIAYTTAFPWGNGSSMQLRDLSYNPFSDTSWCGASEMWPGSAGDFGTPRAATACAAPFVPDTLTVCAARQQDACGVLVRLNDRIVTRGVVTHVDTCRPIAYMQSNNCGVSIYGTAVLNNMQGLARRMQAGDSVQVEGYITQFRGLAELATFASFVPVVTFMGTAQVPASTTIPCVDISSNGASCAGEVYESRQVRIEGVTFANGGGTFSHGDSNYVATCGPNTIMFRVDSCDAVFGTPIPAGPVTVNAIVTQYDSVSCYCEGYQLVYGGGQTFVAGSCPDPVQLTVYRTPLNQSTEQVVLRWQPGSGATCNNYRIYYANDGSAAFPAGYTFLTCVSDATTYIDTPPLSTTPRRFYVVTADSSCP